MDESGRHEREMEIFEQVCDLPPTEREKLLGELCGEDVSLRQRVAAMLAFDGADDHGLDRVDSQTRMAQLIESVNDSPLEGDIPERIAGYRILRKVGAGGMGVIFEAEQDSPRRRVALKVLRPGLFGRDALKRFQHEAQVLGHLQHSGIAQIYEAGMAETGNGNRQPFFAMELVDGEPLDQFCKARALDTRQRLELIARVCDAVQHAHQKGVIHRDLKPNNVLVVANESMSSIGNHDPLGYPKILDFGIARVTDADVQTVTVQTEVGQLVGTLAYMSPEQMAGKSEDIDTRSDVYALGVMLYELLTGKRPHDLTGLPLVEAARIITEADPQPLGQYDRALRGDIETIVSKSLEKDRERRYGSAAELAADIRRFLAVEPIQARPATTTYLIRRFARRNRALVGGLITTFVMLVVALIATGYGLVQSQARQQAAIAANKRLQTVADFQSKMLGEIDVEAMGHQLMLDLRDDARRLAQDTPGPDADKQLGAFEQMLSRIDAAGIANRSLDNAILSRAVQALDEEFDDQPEVRADIRESLAGTFARIGLRKKALEQLKIVQDSRQRALGDKHPAVLRARSHVCDELLRLGEYAQAEECAREVREAQVRVLGADHEDALITGRILGESLVSLTRLDEAEGILKDVLDTTKKTLGPTHDETIQTQIQLANLFMTAGRTDEAKTLLVEVVEERRRTLGEQHSSTTHAMSALVAVYVTAQEFENAERLARLCAESGAQQNGIDNPNTIVARLNHAFILTQMNRHDDAAPIVVDLQERARAVLGPDHPVTINTITLAASLTMGLKQWDNAKELAREALASNLRVLGPDNIKTILSHYNLAVIYHTTGDFESALLHAREAESGFSRVMGISNPRTIMGQFLVGRVLAATGRYDDAVDQYNRSLDMIRGGVATPFELRFRILATSSLLGARRNKEAKLAYEDLLQAYQRESRDRPDVLQAIRLLGARVEFANGNLQATLQNADEAKSYRSTSGESNWQVCMAECIWNAVTSRTGDAEAARKAVDAYKRLLAISDSIEPEERKLILAESRAILIELELDPDE